MEGFQFDLLVCNVQLVDVGLLRISPGWVGIRAGRIALVGKPGEEPWSESAKLVDGGGKYLVPSLIDAHMHIESSFVTPRRFVEAVLPSGTGCVLADPHEIANVCGIRGIEFLLKEAEDLPLDILFALPSCVPATDDSLESAGALLGAVELQQLYSSHPGRFIALGEVMDFISLLDSSSRLHPILTWAKENKLIIDGHCPSLTPSQRQQYFSHGVMADHTLTFPEKIEAELQMGIWVQFQEKSITSENISLLKTLPKEQVLFITDDYSPSHFQYGHLNAIVRKAISFGLDPVEAIASATIRAARYLRQPDIGVIAAGRWANMWLCADLRTLVPEQVFYRGEEASVCLQRLEGRTTPTLAATMHIPTLVPDDISVLREGPIPVIVSNGQNTLTTLEWYEGKGDLLNEPLPAGYSVAVAVGRHSERKEIGVCLVKNYGPLKGAIASTVAHDSHNVIAVGHGSDLISAINQIRSQGGGLCAVLDGQIQEHMELPIAGLLTDIPLGKAAEGVKRFENVMTELGVNHARALTFLVILSLSVSPYIKLTTKGVLDVEKRMLIWHHKTDE